MNRFNNDGDGPRVKVIPISPYDRYACTILDEIRVMLKTYNFAGLASAIEELQQMYQRMEDGLSFYQSIGYDLDRIEKLEAEAKELRQEIKELKAKKWLIEINQDTDKNDNEKDKEDQDVYNQGYKAGLEASKAKKRDKK